MITIPYVQLLGVPVQFAPQVLSSSRAVIMVLLEIGRPVLLAYSKPVFELLLAQEKSGLRFAAWHDWPLNCPTWTDAAGCRCEVEP